jgi:hypothetical protein
MSDDRDDDIVELVQDERDFKGQEIPYMEDPVAQRVVACSFLLKVLGQGNSEAADKAIALLGAVISSIAAPETKVRQVK